MASKTRSFISAYPYYNTKLNWCQEGNKMDATMEIFGQRLKLLRKERNMTQKEIAELLDRTDRQVQALEAGRVNVPGLTLIKLADFFEVSTDYLLGRSEDRQ